MLTHLPEAPTFTSGFAGAWARVAASGKVLIYKADSGLVWWARWPESLRSYWPEEMQACGLWQGGDRQEETRKERGLWGGGSPQLCLLVVSPHSPFFSLFLSSTLFLSRSLWRSPDENSTNQLRINRDSDNTTSNSPFTATGATRGPTQHYSTHITMHVYATISIWLRYEVDIHFFIETQRSSELSFGIAQEVAAYGACKRKILTLETGLSWV